MRKYESAEDSRALNRSTLRNMPSECANCGYRLKPSSSVDQCSKCILRKK
jgi:predicted Zn-ribbon and HTH transcriptional regulator